MSFLNRFREDQPKDDTVASVVRNLTHLLNSKSGYGSPLCGFGLSDHYALPSPVATAEAVMREVLRDIEAYEPRLRPIEIKVLGDKELPFLFELRGEVRRESGRPLPVSGTLSPCRLGILFDPVHGAVSIQVLDAKGEREDVR